MGLDYILGLDFLYNFSGFPGSGFLCYMLLYIYNTARSACLLDFLDFWVSYLDICLRSHIYRCKHMLCLPCTVSLLTIPVPGYSSCRFSLCSWVAALCTVSPGGNFLGSGFCMFWAIDSAILLESLQACLGGVPLPGLCLFLEWNFVLQISWSGWDGTISGVCFLESHSGPCTSGWVLWNSRFLISLFPFILGPVLCLGGPGILLPYCWVPSWVFCLEAWVSAVFSLGFCLHHSRSGVPAGCLGSSGRFSACHLGSHLGPVLGFSAGWVGHCWSIDFSLGTVSGILPGTWAGYTDSLPACWVGTSGSHLHCLLGAWVCLGLEFSACTRWVLHLLPACLLGGYWISTGWVHCFSACWVTGISGSVCLPAKCTCWMPACLPGFLPGVPGFSASLHCLVSGFWVPGFSLHMPACLGAWVPACLLSGCTWVPGFPGCLPGSVPAYLPACTCYWIYILGFIYIVSGSIYTIYILYKYIVLL